MQVVVDSGCSGEELEKLESASEVKEPNMGNTGQVQSCNKH